MENHKEEVGSIKMYFKPTVRVKHERVNIQIFNDRIQMSRISIMCHMGNAKRSWSFLLPCACLDWEGEEPTFGFGTDAQSLIKIYFCDTIGFGAVC